MSVEHESKSPAIFLDRDGTINQDRGYVYRIEDFAYIDGAVDGMRALGALGYRLVIISNQSGIARGFYSETDYHKLTAWMVDDLREKGILILGTYFCPHLPMGVVAKYTKECNCRKPNTELFYQAVEELNLTFKGSYAIGDKLRDLSICEETETTGILFRGENSLNKKKFQCCDSWEKIVQVIERQRDRK